ncbi:importin-alpha export receptor [Exophiala xenobiotica]|nr:importin-alpha export receptor [Exophiala xenobiotica]KAK5250669.1 importin-alpha export receptor [Exophiala xenobiotica]KAK5353279.1 importin-alpha export receptor [Exophiala xenobiotica]KAK5380060.1 importin-alpha export receptor [Exophiala xenobiotica]KAK5390881.1 importin-alpha export receptor [Exophiala xenobiotica]
MANLAPLAQLLDASLDPRQNKEAELKIRAEEKKPGFALSLLQITASSDFQYNTRLASALFFKNFIKRNWTDVEGNYKLPQQDVTSIKTEIVGLMISVPRGIQTQLGEAISVIADSDFWERWDTLVDDLVSRLKPDNPVDNAGVLQVAHSIFARWRPLYESDELFTEINHVLGKLSQPFLSQWQSLDAYIDSHSNDKQALQNAFAELDLVLLLFYDLSCQDMPPVFEDNLQGISALLLKYLTYNNELLQTDDESEPGPLENTKANIFEALTLYMGKFYEDFGRYVTGFVESSWHLLTTTGPEPKNDILVSKALHFLTSVADNRAQVQSFSDPNVQTQIVEKVILPNVALRDSDVEMFEDEPIEFIRRDLEGSDSETRRRAAGDFLRQLSDQFEQSVTQIATALIQQCLQQFSSNPSENWRSKDTAVSLFYALASKGATTSTHGVTKTNSLVDIGDFFSTNLASDLQNETQPLIKVDAIKYLYVFRSIITKEQWQQVMPLLVNHLGNSNYCVYTYAAVAVERVLAMTDETGKPVIDPASIAPLASDLLEHLFSLVEKDRAPEKVQENEFVMRCIMRVLIILREGVSTVAESVLQHLTTITNIIAANPSNPKFYYYHFESIGALIRFTPAAQSEALGSVLFNPFAAILSNQVEEFIPYVFQLLAALLEAEPTKPLPDQYKPLIAPILGPSLWEQRGNVPALARLLSSIVPRAADELMSANQVGLVLGIFQKLVSTKVFEGYGFDLLETVVSTFPGPALDQYWLQILNIMLTRLQKGQSQAFQLRFIRFYHFVSSRDDKGLGADFFVAASDRVQHDVFRQLYTGIILPKTQELARPLDRKVAAISLTKTLADSQAFVDRYPKGWPLTCNALLKLLEDPPLPPTEADVVAELDVEDSSFGVGFTQLNTVRRPTSDPFAEVTDLRKWVGQYLKAADQRHGGRIGRVVNEGLSPDAKKVLNAYMML